jgi:isopenicillin N synthase-like dioxygenase
MCTKVPCAPDMFSKNKDMRLELLSPNVSRTSMHKLKENHTSRKRAWPFFFRHGFNKHNIVLRMRKKLHAHQLKCLKKSTGQIYEN